MESLPCFAFSRRPDRDGTIVSTCNTCFTAVAASLRQADLEKAERGHACNPGALEHWKALLAEVKRRNQRRQQQQLN